jgi:hypothetical protein
LLEFIDAIGQVTQAGGPTARSERFDFAALLFREPNRGPPALIEADKTEEENKETEQAIDAIIFC